MTKTKTKTKTKTLADYRHIKWTMRRYKVGKFLVYEWNI